MNSLNSKLKGVVNSSVGAVKQAAGKAINDPDLEREGLAQKVNGNIQKIKGAIESKLENAAASLGDKITHLVD